jgi:hypothetical protein
MELIYYVQAINAAMLAAKELAPVVTKTKEWVETLFTSGAITAAQQDQLKAVCDQHMNARLRGDRPPELVVDAGPNAS